MNTVKPQVINGFMLAAGFEYEDEAKIKAESEAKIIAKAEKAEKSKERRVRLTGSVIRQKKMVQAVLDGFNTTDKAKCIKRMSSLSLLRHYFKRLSDDLGYLSKVKNETDRELYYSVTDKGLAFIGADNA